MIELSQIICFLTIYEEKSFSRAAEKLGLAQSAVSQKLKRLEDVLNMPLFNRTSRSLKLTSEGEYFIPFAKKMIASEESARFAAQEIKNRVNNTIILGGYSFTNFERTLLIEKFLKEYKKYQVEVHHGTRQELMQKLMNRELDALTALVIPDDYNDEFDSCILGKKYGHIAIPITNPLAQKDIIKPNDLMEQKLAISPGRLDSRVLNRICQYLIDFGAELIVAPEADPNSIENFARLKNINYLRWYHSIQPPKEIKNYKIIPFQGQNMIIDSVLYYNKDTTKKITNDLIGIANQIKLS